MAKQYDFGGYATRNDLRCSDGRTIRRGAFTDCDGKVVPLVWQHLHNDPANVLGHALLEERSDGMYTYCKFNDTDAGRNAKALVEHGDVTALSIYANQLKEQNANVLHGMIREVSLVLAGANPGAYIDSLVIEHGDVTSYDGDEAVIYNDEELEIVDDEEYDEDEDDEEYDEDEDDEEYYDDEDEDDESYDDEEEYYDDDDEIEHADREGETMAKERTVQDVFDTLNEEQKNVVYAIIGQAIEDAAGEQEDGEVKHNAFDTDDMEMETDGYLSHSDVDEIFEDAKRYGSLRDSVLAHTDGAGIMHSDDYGIDNIDYLFPDARNLNRTPEFIKRETGWVQKVMSGVHHTPFSRIKSVFADITEADARAKGYLKGHLKKEEVFGLLKRTTTPTTIYKKQKLDRDDIVDITDFDVVAWLKSEMRMMLDEEIARAILIGDGRSASSDDKISELNVRPIWTDADLFTVKKTVSVANTATDEQKAKAFIKAIIRARKDYKGSGNPTLYTTEDMITSCLLIEDGIGRTIYDSIDKLATVLRVKEIVPVEVMENLSRIDGANTMYLMGILVNLNDYNVGADKGGEVNMFDDFDIDYNQQKYLIETRCSGALTKPFSAVAIEMVYGMILDIEGDSPATTLFGKLVSDLQDNVLINGDYIEGHLKYVTGYTGFSGDASEQEGNYLALKFTAPVGATTTVELVGSGKAPKTLDSDMECVFRITNKNFKLKVVSTSGDLSETKIYSLRGLKLDPKD